MTLEDIVNRWSTDLDDRVREFTNLAQEVKEWDSILLSNGEDIRKLLDELQALDPISNTINGSLDYVEQEQQALAGYMDQYEAQIDELLAGRSGGQSGSGMSSHTSGGANSEREKTYRLAEDLNNQLDDLSRSLTALINDVNSLSASAGITQPSSADKDASSQDPVSAIAAILNAHLSSLSWIEKTGDSLAQQVEELEGRLKTASGDKWQGLSSSRSINNNGNLNSSSRSYGTPTRSLMGPQRTNTPSSGARSSPNGFGSSMASPARNAFGSSTPGRSGTPSRLGQSGLARSGVFGLGARR
jgi:nuclear pore complex protein Nup62